MLGAAARIHPVGFRILSLIGMAVEVNTQLRPSTRHVTKSAAQRKCKGGAELVWIELHAAGAGGNARAEVHYWHEAVPTLLTREIERDVRVEQIQPDVMPSELRGGSALRRIDREPLAAHPREPDHQRSWTTESLFVAKSKHRTTARHDPD